MRRTLIATTGVLALGAGLVVPTSAALAADTDTATAAVDAGKRTGVKVTLKGPKTDPVAGDAVTVKGKAMVKKQPVAKAKVKLLRKKGSKWVGVTKTKTNKKGKYRKQVTLPNKPSVKLRAKLVKPTRVKGTVSKTLTVTFTQPVTAGNPAPTSPAPTQTSSPAPVITAPDAPTNVTAEAGDRQADLSWTAPANNGGSAVTGYRVQINSGSGWSTTVANTGSAATNYVANDLLDFTTHRFRVAAINSAGLSDFSLESAPLELPQPGSMTQISRAFDGTEANGPSYGPVWSPDGSHIAFTSQASDLVAGVTDSNSTDDVFVMELATGAVTLVSPAANGTTTGDNGSYGPVWSPDGSHIAFTSWASDLVAGVTDSNGTRDVFVMELATGAVTLVSQAANGTTTGDSASYRPVWSPDGSHIAFYSRASDLVAGVTDSNSTDDVFVMELATGAVTLVSQAANGTTTGDNGSYGPVWSPDSSHIAFYSYASDLVAGVTDSNGTRDVFVMELATGAVTLVSQAANGTTTGDNASYRPVWSPDSSHIAFTSGASDLVAGVTDSNSAADSAGDVFVMELATGAVTLVSQAANGTKTGDNGSDGPVWSPDSSHIAFYSDASDLVAGVTDSNDLRDVFVMELATGAVTLVSQAANGTTTGDNASYRPVWSPDSSHIAFYSKASDLVDGVTDSNSTDDVFVMELATGAVTLVSQAANGTTTGDDWSYDPVWSPDSSHIAFYSRASDLVAGVTDSNSTDDVFVMELATGAVTLVSQAANGTTTGSDWSYDPVWSPDGSHIAFSSEASDLVDGDSTDNGVEDIFVKTL
jgi:Tol biopolymer transport system component